MRLSALAPAKVNLSLFLGRPRDDGRHELVTLFESVSLADELELVSQGGGADLGRHGCGADEVRCPGVPEPNLAAQALTLLRAGGWEAPPVRIEIRKRAPVAGGMGGGSADAACVLRLAAQLAPLPRSLELSELAFALGADVPAQLEPGLALGTGAGELVRRLPPLAAHALAVVPLCASLSTARVYAEADRLRLPRSPAELDAKLAELTAVLARRGALPDELLVNDLEPAARGLCPPIARALGALSDAGAAHAFVCGSGPTVAGLFWGEDGMKRAGAAAERLRGRFPGALAASPVQPDFAAPRRLR